MTSSILSSVVNINAALLNQTNAKLYLRRTPPRSEALRHSGGDNLLWTSATVTLYLDVELSSESLPGTEQKMSAGVVGIRTPSFPLWSRCRIPAKNKDHIT